MFGKIILSIFRSTRLCVTACGTMHRRCRRPVAVYLQGNTVVRSDKHSAWRQLCLLRELCVQDQTESIIYEAISIKYYECAHACTNAGVGLCVCVCVSCLRYPTCNLHFLYAALSSVCGLSGCNIIFLRYLSNGTILGKHLL